MARSALDSRFHVVQEFANTTCSGTSPRRTKPVTIQTSSATVAEPMVQPFQADSPSASAKRDARMPWLQLESPTKSHVGASSRAAAASHFASTIAYPMFLGCALSS